MLHNNRMIIHSLPEDQQAPQRLFFTEDEWMGRAYHPILDRSPHQMPPTGNDWATWTVIGPPGTGKTTAGMLWLFDMFMGSAPLETVHGVVSETEFNIIGARISTLLNPHLDVSLIKSDRGVLEYVNDITGAKLALTTPAHRFGYDAKYLWWDDAEDAQSVVKRYSQWATHIVFTNPTKLPDDTVVSRPNIKD